MFPFHFAGSHPCTGSLQTATPTESKQQTSEINSGNICISHVFKHKPTKVTKHLTMSGDKARI